MNIYSLSISCFVLSASFALAGGIELQTLDTSVIYEQGNHVAFSTARIDASVEGFNTGAGLAAVSKKQTVTDQTVTNITAKFDFGENLSFGLTTYRSGAIKLSGGNGVNGNLAPTGDVDLDTTAFMIKYSLNQNMSLLGGITQNSLQGGNVTTLAGSYDVSGASKQGYFVGAAYSIPEIALRAELLYQPKTKIDTTASFAGTGPLTGFSNPSSVSSLSLPESYALSFQTGIAADTLLIASYRKAMWSKSQVDVNVSDIVPFDGANIATTFADSEAYSIGIGRKFTDNLSGSITYSNEKGSSSTSTSLFTVSNGSEAISAGLKYTRDNMAVSAGVSRRNVGDVIVNAAGIGQMKYSGNSVTSMGLKVSFAF